MKYAAVANNVKKLVADLPPEDEFIFELLLAYGIPKATISRLKKGQLNLATEPGEVLLKKKVCFKPAKVDLFSAMETLKAAKGTKSNDPRFLIVTDFDQMLALDCKAGDTLDIEVRELETHFDFFLPWAGMEKTKLSNENPADIKAAEKMAKLFDVIKQENPEYVRDNPHWMNIFLSRLLFCLFAEDTGIFPENAVCNAVASHTAVDGSDLTAFFMTLFNLLDTPSAGLRTGEDRDSLPEHLKVFPYVNGGLFQDHYPLPQFSAKARRMIIEAGKLDWKDINPDIFGSMFQAVIDPEERHNLGQHYTSVTNIMKVIEPLFLNNFKEDLEKASNLAQKNMRAKALHQLHDRIANVKIFDPACGSGNFLIIAYKELRRLEMEVFEGLNAFPVSKITVNQFYGIEIADFACETAILALWLAEHQMNLEYEKRFKQTLTSLPLKDGANIVCGNATRIEWETVCPKNDGDEIYILGNPPYLGYSLQIPAQKADIACVFSGMKNFKKLDYISCWFLKGAKYIQRGNAKFAFVSTNSICQGEQAGLLWPHIFNKNLEIAFAHQSFKWGNNAKGNAGVTCIIVGVRNTTSENSAYIFTEGISRQVAHINAYLTTGSNVIVVSRRTALSNLPRMLRGNGPSDGGNLILTKKEHEDLLVAYPQSEAFIKRFNGSDDFINGDCRWCLWIEEHQIKQALQIPPIADRVECVKQMRLQSPKAATKALAAVPHRFAEIRCGKSDAILIPRHTGERRQYIPFGFLDGGTIVSDSAQAIYDPKPWVFGVIASGMHMIWVRATCGKLETRIRYSSQLCYNTFPIPDLTDGQKQAVTMHVGTLLEEREKHPEKTMAQLYDPDKMPDGLRGAHHQLDLAVDRIYRAKPFDSDEERLEHLFKLYEEMIAKEQLV